MRRNAKYDNTTDDVVLYKGQIWIAEQYLILTLHDISERYLIRCRSRFRATAPKKKIESSDGKHYVYSDTGYSWRYGRWYRTFYYCFDNISNQLPCCYREQLPSRGELKKVAVKY